MTIRLAALAFAALGLTAAAPPPDPLKQLCDRLCGGTWQSSEIPVPDQFVTTYRYEWDARLGLVHGVQITVGGVGGIHTESDVFFGRDPSSGTLWMMTVRSDGPALYGTFELGSDGYQTTVQALGGEAGKMISTFAFTGPDEYAVTSEFLSKDEATRSLPQTWRRQKD